MTREWSARLTMPCHNQFDYGRVGAWCLQPVDLAKIANRIFNDTN
jgi:hypothetical protein